MPAPVLLPDLDGLFDALRVDGRDIVGPTVRAGAIVLAVLAAPTDLRQPTCRPVGEYSSTAGPTGCAAADRMGRFQPPLDLRELLAGRREDPQWADVAQRLVASLEAALRLRRHRAGSLPALDHYLHDRTAGMIGSLSHLIRGAAIDAVLTGTEAITKPVLDRVELDHAVDSQHTSKRRRR